MKILKFKKQSKDKYMLYLDDNSKITLSEDIFLFDKRVIIISLEYPKLIK